MSFQATTTPNTGKTCIIAYGFDGLDFDLPEHAAQIDQDVTVVFEALDSPRNLDSAQGAIIPQGIFEEIEILDSYSGQVGKVKVRHDLLLDKEREVSNLIATDNWVCFLVGEVVDKVPDGYRSPRPVRDTDLCKKLLNQFGIGRDAVKGLAQLQAKDNAFVPYVRKYGVARTVLHVPRDVRFQMRPIAQSGNSLVGLEVESRVFFLPFHTTKRDSETLISIVKTVSQAVSDYRQKHTISLPDWLVGFEFEKERELQSAFDVHIKKAKKLRAELAQWGRRKAVLTTSGETLRQIVIEILTRYFGFRVEHADEYREDLKIVDQNSEPFCLLEVKGVKTGIKRDYINQVDSHRERNSLPSSTPGALIINNEMDLIGIDRRLDTTVPEQHIKHARSLNVLIVRTIDLLFLMRHLETKDLQGRRAEFLQVLNSGGGWLKADPDRYELIEGQSSA